MGGPNASALGAPEHTLEAFIEHAQQLRRSAVQRAGARREIQCEFALCPSVRFRRVTPRGADHGHR